MGRKLTLRFMRYSDSCFALTADSDMFIDNSQQISLK